MIEERGEEKGRSPHRRCVIQAWAVEMVPVEVGQQKCEYSQEVNISSWALLILCTTIIC